MPLIALVLAVGWCLAQALNAPVLGAVVAASAIAAGAAIGLRRRASSALLLPWLAVLCVVVAGVALAILSAPPGGPRLWLSYAVMAALAPIVPVLYARTFPMDGDEP